MMKKITLILFVALMATACSDSEKEEDKKEEGKSTEKVEEEKAPEKTSELSVEDYMNKLQEIAKITNDESVNEIYKVTLELERIHSGDHNSAKALFRSARILNDHAIADVAQPNGVVKRGVSLKALDLVNLLIEKYPDFEMIKPAYDLKAGILDGNLRMKEEAVEMYKMLLEKYPNDSMNVAICNDRIANIDKDPYAFLKSL